MTMLTRRRAIAGLAALPALALARPVDAAWAPDPRNTLDLIADFGAVPGQDVTGILSAAFPQLAGPRTALNLPPGNWIVSGPLPPLPAGAKLTGSPGSALWMNSLLPVLQAGAFARISDFAINWSGAGTRSTAAIHVPVGANSVTISNVDTHNLGHVAVHAGSASIVDCTARFSVANPSCVAFELAGQAVFNRLRRPIVIGASPAAPIGAGIRIRAGGVTVEDPFVTCCGAGLLIDPGPGQLVADCGISGVGANGGFDRCGDGVLLLTTGGAVERVRISNTWVGSGERGLTAWGVIDGLDLDRLDICGCTGDGIWIGPTSNAWLHDSRVTGNAHGVHVSSVGRLVSTNNRIGPWGGFANVNDVTVDPGGVFESAGDRIGAW